jgi:molybdate transport system ATP-binding protein
METLELDICVPVRSFDVDVALELPPGVFALAGPSGAGKSTILRSIAGLVRPSRGWIALGATVWFDPAARIDLEPQARSVGVVFQDYALFPHLSVAKNVAFGASGSIDGLLERFRIEHLAGEHPAFLSGGERQRVALARALAREPDVLLLDEPLAALDAGTRERVRGELGELLREVALPTVLVSHDFEDAAALAERVGILVDGRIVQTGSPAALVADPRTAFVASFTGSNLLRGHARAGTPTETRVSLEGGASVVVADRGKGAVGVVVAPSSVAIAPVAQRGESVNELEVTVSSAVPRGDRVRVASGLLAAEVPFELARGMDLTPGAAIVMSFAAEAARLVPLGDH